MWPTIFNTNYSKWKTRYENLKIKYGEVVPRYTNPFLESKLRTNDKITSIKLSDFTSYFQSAASGTKEALKEIEYTSFHHIILNELILVWFAMVIFGDTKINAIAKIKRAVHAEMPINDYAVIEQMFDQVGAEKYSQTLFLKEMQNNQ